jgi:hypothetical protein
MGALLIGSTADWHGDRPSKIGLRRLAFEDNSTVRHEMFVVEKKA